MAKKMSNPRPGVTWWLLIAALAVMSGVGGISAHADDDNDTSRWVWKPWAEIGAHTGANAVLLEEAGSGGRVMVVGTNVEELEGVTRSILVDPVDPDGWHQGQLLSGNRISPSLTVVPSGNDSGLVLAAGGYRLELVPVAPKMILNSVDSCELIDPQGTGTAAPTGHMKTARAMHAAIQLDDQGILVAGGLTLKWKFVFGAYIPYPTALNSSELYVDGNWTPSKYPMSKKRFSAPAVVLTKGPHAGKVLVVGGFVPPDNPQSLTFPATATCEIYDPDPTKQTWTVLPSKESLKVPRGAHTVTLLGDGRVLVAGGQDGFAFKSDEMAKIKTYRSWEIYDPEKKTWTLYGDPDKGEQINRLKRLMFPAAGHTATLLDDDKVLLVGGGQRYLTQLYDPEKNAWQLTTDALWYPRSYIPFLGGHTATLVNGKVLVCEGGAAKCEFFQPPSTLLPSGVFRPAPMPLTAD